jgi:methylase of polypeptide subunit release factors
MDALERDRDILRSLDLALVVEIGSGSGVVSAFVACTFYFYEFPKNDFIQQSLLSSANSAISRVFNARVSTSRSSFFSLCTDLNPAASNCSQDTAQRNDVHCKTGAIICNLLDPLRFS